MKKNFKKLVFTLIMVFGFGLVNVNAEVYVGDNNMDTTNTVAVGNGTVSWNRSTKTLTLNNVNISMDSGENGIIQFINETGSIIDLKGTNTLVNTGDYYGIYVSNDLTIKGDGTLNVTAKYRTIKTGDILVIDGAKLDLTASANQANMYALEAEGLTIKNNANVKVTATGVAIGVFSDIVINESTVDVNSTLNFHAAILVDNSNGGGDVIINKSTVNAKSAYVGIQTDANVNIVESTLDLKATNYGILAIQDVNIDGSTIKTTDSDYGIYSSSDLIISDSKVTLDNSKEIGAYASNTINIIESNVDSSTDYGTSIQAGNLVTIANSTVSTKGDKYGIRSSNSTISLEDSKINIDDVSYAFRVPNSKTINVNNTQFDVNSAGYIFKNAPALSNLDNKRVYAGIETDGSDAKVVTITSGADLTQYKYLHIVSTYNIKVITSDNVSVNTKNSFVVEEGDKLNFEFTVDKGCLINSLAINDEESLSSLKDNKLSLTAEEDLTIRVNAVLVNVDAPEISKDAEIKEVTVGVTNTNLLNELFANAINKSNLDYTNLYLKVLVDINNIDVNDLNETTINDINKKGLELGDLKISNYFDITLRVLNQRSNLEVATISELDSKIKLQVALPNELTTVNEGYTRTYYIIRYHDNKAEVLNTTLDNNILTFESDKFSTYALAYVDTKKDIATNTETNPNTGDNIGFYTIISLISILGIVGTVKLSKKTN